MARCESLRRARRFLSGEARGASLDECSFSLRGHGVSPVRTASSARLNADRGKHSACATARRRHPCFDLDHSGHMSCFQIRTLEAGCTVLGDAPSHPDHGLQPTLESLRWHERGDLKTRHSIEHLNEEIFRKLLESGKSVPMSNDINLQRGWNIRLDM